MDKLPLRRLVKQELSQTGIYTDFFNFRERPFSLLPDPDFIFWTNQYRRAFTILEYGIVTRAPITVITGEVGIGKTTLVQALLQTVEHNTTVGLISNAQGGRGDLLRWALNSLGAPNSPSLDYVGLFQELQDFLLGEYASGRHVVLIIDEAQNLSIDLLEELRMLTNINSNKDELLQLVLVGQPELREILTRPSMRQFAQRVVASFHLSAMDHASVEKYVEHRLRHAGGTGTEISKDAILMIYENTGGIPRLVNKLADFALVYAAASEEHVVDANTVADVLSDGIFIETRENEADSLRFGSSRIQAEKAAE
jgi:general secretion pathway protein A